VQANSLFGLRGQQVASSVVEEAVARTAASFTVDVASLRARVRIALFCPTVDIESNIYHIVEEQAEALGKGRGEVACHFISNISDSEINLLESKLVHLPPETGCLISSAVHYLQSARPTSCHFGLEDPRSNRLMSYASVDALDWDVLVNALQVIDENAEQLALSRIYASNAAPRNTISHMLSLLIQEYAKSGRKTVVSTTVDPNLGFRGTSYRASNWTELFSVPHLGYLYVDGQFRTRRQLIQTFGSDNPDELASLLGPRLQMSGPLKSDTMVFATATNRNLRLALQNFKLQRLERHRT
jgi:hypothetical protein